jgi:hypothetical protein
MSIASAGKSNSVYNLQLHIILNLGAEQIFVE